MEVIAADTDADDIVAQTIITKTRAQAVAVSKCIVCRCCDKLMSSVQLTLFIPTIESSRQYGTNVAQRTFHC